MNILLIGGAGFLGRNLRKKLSDKHDVFVIDVEKNSSFDSRYYCADIEDVEGIIKVIIKNQIDIVVNLASRLLPGSTLEQYNKEISLIDNSIQRLLKYLAESKIKYVYFSSGGSIYGIKDHKAKENDALEPINYYGQSKKYSEEMIKKYHKEYGLSYIIVRPSNPYGPGQNLYGKQGIIAVVIGKIIKNETIEIWGDGNNKKDYIYIDDFVECISRLINSNFWNEIYNIGSGSTASINRILDIIKEKRGFIPEIRYIPQKNTDVQNFILDCSKFNNLFNVSYLPIEEGIEEFLKVVFK